MKPLAMIHRRTPEREGTANPRMLTKLDGHAVILFDGVCNLCNGWVLFVIRRDRPGYFRFAALQSSISADLLARHSAPPDLPDSIVLLENDRFSTRSTAALRIARRLRFPWSLAIALIVIPRQVRDWAYDFIARRRYRWFGRREECMVPTPELRERFLG